MSSLREWRKSKKLSQEDLGRKLGFGDQWKTYQSYESGRTPFPADIKAKIGKMGFEGPWPESNGEVTREDLEALRRDLRDHQAWAMEEIRKGQTALGAALQELLKRTQPSKESR